MKFTIKEYKKLIDLIKKNQYQICDYVNSENKCVVLRHDVDFDMEKAVSFSALEKELNIHAMYFVLITSDFYNILSSQNQYYLREIINNGGKIGLHFDETRYEWNTKEDLQNFIYKEIQILEKIINLPVTMVSMHRPSQKLLKMNIQLKGIVNSYSREYFDNYKYVSDSRRLWRENVTDIIQSNMYKKLQILTHPFWYYETEKDTKSSILDFINKQRVRYYIMMKENFTSLEDFLSKDEL